MITLIGNSHPLQEISIKALVGYLKSYNIPVRSIYLADTIKLTDDIINKIIQLSNDSILVGFSLMTKDWDIMLPAVRQVREKLGVPVILGGIHPTALPSESLRYCDFVCVGEGEEPMRLLYNALLSETFDYNIPNIGYKIKDKIIVNKTSYFAKSLEELPYPDYEFDNGYILVYGTERIRKIPNESEKKGNFFNKNNFYFYSQRGCKYACTYCSNSIYHKLYKGTNYRWYRMATPERIKNELLFILKKLPFIKQIVINDDDSLARPLKELEEISTFIKQELKLPFTINGIPACVDEKKISTLVNNGLRAIAFGVQSGSQKILHKLYGRPQTNKQVLEAAEVVNKFSNKGLSVDYGFILDNPYENESDRQDSLRLLISLPKPRTISLYSLEFFPGTKLTKKAIDDNIIPSLSSEFNKDYRMHIKFTYSNTLFFLNAFFDIPNWLNKILLSDSMVESPFASPIRFVFANPIRHIIKFHPNIPLANRVTLRDYIKPYSGVYNLLRKIRDASRSLLNTQ